MTYDETAVQIPRASVALSHLDSGCQAAPLSQSVSRAQQNRLAQLSKASSVARVPAVLAAEHLAVVNAVPSRFRTRLQSSGRRSRAGSEERVLPPPKNKRRGQSGSRDDQQICLAGLK